jgi:hypothetical protein
MKIAPENRARGVVIKMSLETHKKFKIKLIQHGITMQDAFEGFAQMIADESPSANILVEKMVIAAVNNELAEAGLGPQKKRKRLHMIDIDNERLYDLIGASEIDTDRGE